MSGPSPSLSITLGESIRIVDFVTRTASAARQALQAALVQQLRQMPRRGGFGYFRNRLILPCAEALFETAFTAIEQAIEHFDLLR